MISFPPNTYAIPVESVLSSQNCTFLLLLVETVPPIYKKCPNCGNIAHVRKKKCLYRGVGNRFNNTGGGGGGGGGVHLTVTKQVTWRHSFAHPDICESVFFIIKLLYQNSATTEHAKPISTIILNIELSNIFTSH